MTDQSKLAFIDTETTGLDPHLCPVWEVAVIVDEIEHLWQVRVPTLMLRDATKIDLFEKVTALHVDGSYYEFAGVS